MKRRAFLGASGLAVTGLSGCLGDTEYRVAEAAAENSPEPLSVSVTLAVPTATVEHPAELAFTLENAADEPVEIRSYGVWPFGVLALAPSPTPDENAWTTTLYSPSYEASDRVEVRPGRSGMSLDGRPLTRALDPGASVSGRYVLHGDDLPRPGTYYVVEKSSAYRTGEEWTPLDYRIRTVVAERGRLPL